MLIKITARNSREAILSDVHLIEKTLEAYDPLIFPAFVELVKNKVVMHALIKINRETWVDHPLLASLRSLPLHITVNVDPESLL